MLYVVPDKFNSPAPEGYTIEDWFLNEEDAIAEYRPLGIFKKFNNEK